MKKSKFVLGLFAALTVNALVACGDDSSSAPTSAPIDDVANSSSSVDVAQDSRSSSSGVQSDISSSSVLMNSSSSSMIFIPELGSSSSVIIPSCGTAVYTEKCIDTEFEGVTCDAIGCRPTDCFEEQKGMEAYSCNGGSVMICDGTHWQYTNCAMPIINPNSSSSSVILDPESLSSAMIEEGSSSSSEWRGGECIDQEGDTRYDEMYEYECKNGKWKIIGYRPGACVGDMDCGTSSVSSEQTRCKALVVDGLQVEGSACKIEDGYNKSENGCEFFCYGGKWEYTPPPM